MKLSELVGQGIADRACGSYGLVLKSIREADADEAQDKADAAYRLMWSTSEQLAETVKELRSLGHKDLREMRVLAILNDAILALEAEGLGA